MIFSLLEYWKNDTLKDNKVTICEWRDKNNEKEHFENTVEWKRIKEQVKDNLCNCIKAIHCPKCHPGNIFLLKIL